jgi:hypothetical protein
MFHRKFWRELGIRHVERWNYGGHMHIYRCGKCQQKQRVCFFTEYNTDFMP